MMTFWTNERHYQVLKAFLFEMLTYTVRLSENVCSGLKITNFPVLIKLLKHMETECKEDLAIWLNVQSFQNQK